LRPGGRLVTTVIHFNQTVDSTGIIKGSAHYPRGVANFHWAKVLLEDFGGWYPRGDQLAIGADGAFTQIKHVDATEDYHWTSEYWLVKMKRETARNPKVWAALAGKIIAHPRATISMLDDLIISQSWMWQFRADKNGNTPTTLWRDVWERI